MLDGFQVRRGARQKRNFRPKKKYPAVLLVAFSLVASAPLARAQKVSNVQSQGNDTYTVTVTATNKFTRNTDRLKAAGISAAMEYCNKEGKQFKLVSAEDHKGMYLVGPMADTVVTFKALPPGSPELAATAPAPVPMPAAAAPVSPAVDEFSADMVKLDELHKRGILTDEEYAAAKKKVLDRLK
ncbi:MAG TPA: SHOCT domain-containing protein [Candidatus Didemnitutus sp.]|nr:SHOCT domain-containing protein [Candidatus Didemnitutus sp.]